MFDLQDAVAADDGAKQDARKNLLEALAHNPGPDNRVNVRINDLGSRWFHDDVRLVASLGIGSVTLSSLRSAAEVTQAEGLMHSLGVQRETTLHLDVDSPALLLDLQRHPLAFRMVQGLNVAPMDYGFSLGVRLDETSQFESTEWLDFYRHQVLTLAKANGLSAIDAVQLGADDSSVVRSMKTSRSWGFDGTYVVRPAHISLANDCYGVSAERVEWAERILAAWQTSGPDSQSSVRMLDGKAIFPTVREYAARDLHFAKRLG